MIKKLKDGSTILPTHDWSWRSATWRAYVQLLKRTDWPILMGPWRGEIGFEVLYWIAMLDDLVVRHGIKRERFIPISRGGAAAWYGTPTGLELYAMRSVQDCRVQLRLEHERTGMMKQVTVSPFDRQILKDAAQTLGLGRAYHVLHPAWMYHTMAPYWTAHRGLDWLSHRTAYRPIPIPSLPDGLRLPDPFVAVRFYARQTFQPSSKLVKRVIPAILEQLTEKYHVVLLDPDLFIDDHVDLTKAIKGPRISHVQDYLPDLLPETNLSVLSAIMGRSLGFVGTYGGFAQLALRLGTASVSFYDQWHMTSLSHKELADLLTIRTQIPAQVFRLADLPMLHDILPAAEMQAPAKSPLQSVPQGRILTPV